MGPSSTTPRTFDATAPEERNNSQLTGSRRRSTTGPGATRSRPVTSGSGASGPAATRRRDGLRLHADYAARQPGHPLSDATHHLIPQFVPGRDDFGSLPDTARCRAEHRYALPLGAGPDGCSTAAVGGPRRTASRWSGVRRPGGRRVRCPKPSCRPGRGVQRERRREVRRVHVTYGHYAAGTKRPADREHVERGTLDLSL